MHRLLGRLLVLLGVTVVFPVISLAQDGVVLSITGVWARATVAAPVAEATPEMGAEATMEAGSMMGGSMDAVSAAYMTIENGSDQALKLVSATTAAAGLVEIHEVTMENDVMKMRPVEGGLEIPAGGSVELKPGGYHVMLMELKQDFVPSEAISLTLKFEVLDADGAASGEMHEVMVGAPILAEAPAANGDLVIANAWARPTVAESAGEMGGQMGNMAATPEVTSEAGGMGMMGGSMDAVSAVYMTILNRGEQADRLVSAATAAAASVEIHEVTMENDVMRMRPVEGGIEISAGGSVELKPGGYHVMLMELRQDFVPGAAIELTLTFESGAEVTIGVPIYDPMMSMGD